MTYSRWQIWLAQLDPVVGSEQGKTRPVIIISDDDVNKVLSIVNVLPLTSRKAGRMIYPNEVLVIGGNFGLQNESIVLCQQIRTLDKKRFFKHDGTINDISLQEQIVTALKFQLAIP
jgi:mRNA interferase MazF